MGGRRGEEKQKNLAGLSRGIGCEKLPSIKWGCADRNLVTKTPRKGGGGGHERTIEKNGYPNKTWRGERRDGDKCY